MPAPEQKNQQPIPIMIDSIEIGTEGEQLPIRDILTGRGFITGKSGSGKSNSISVIIEQLLTEGYPVLIVDTDGEYWGLKEEFELLHVGADEECDIQVGPEHAEKLATLALDDNVPIILDVSGYIDEDEARDLIRETATHLFAKEKKLQKPFLLVVEECHEYIPEQTHLDDTGRMLVKIGKRGRKHGLGIVGVSQRPANVKKDFITQANWLCWHRLTWDTDRTTVRKVLGSEYEDTITELDTGEAFLTADWEDQSVRRLTFNRKQTFDAGATPGLDDIEPPELKAISGDLVDDLQSISERADTRQTRIEELEAELEAARQENDELAEQLERARDLNDVVQQLADAMADAHAINGGGGAATALATETDASLHNTVEMLIEERDDLSAELELKDERIAELEARVDELEAYKEQVPNFDGLDLEEAEEAIVRLTDALTIDLDTTAVRRPNTSEVKQSSDSQSANEPQQPDPPDLLSHPAIERQLNRLKGSVNELDEKQTAMLEWYKYYGPGAAADAYFHAGGSRHSSLVSKKNSSLRDRGYIEKVDRGEYKYALDTHVRSQFSDNPRVDEETLSALVANIEDELEL